MLEKRKKDSINMRRARFAAIVAYFHGGAGGGSVSSRCHIFHIVQVSRYMATVRSWSQSGPVFHLDPVVRVAKNASTLSEATDGSRIGRLEWC